MQDIQQRDDNLYRVVLQADPVSDAVRKAGYGGQTAMNSYGIWRMPIWLSIPLRNWIC